MKCFMLFGSLILIGAYPVIAIPTIAYKSMLAENNVLDDLCWEGKTPFKIEWEHQPTDSMMYDQASMDGEITGASLAASIDGLEFGNSINRISQHKNIFWFKTMASGSHGNSRPSGTEFAPGLPNGVAIDARPFWLVNNGSSHANANALGVVSHSPPVAPAPGAILFGSIGVGVVGWLHRRKKL